MSDSPVELPRFVSAFLRAIVPPRLLEEIEGDLLERFEADVILMGRRRATRRLYWNSIRYFRPGILFRNAFHFKLIQMSMLYSYFRIMIRAMMKRKLHSAINVFGLTAGITFALALGLFVFGELQVNKDFTDVDRIYFLESKYNLVGDGDSWMAPAPLLPEWMANHPGKVQSYYRFWDRQVTVSKGDKHFRIQSMIGDSTFQNTFGFPVLHGDAVHALDQPNSVIITEKIANQYFGRTDVVGETLMLKTEINGDKEFMVKAVIKNPQPKNSVSDFMNMDAQIFIPLSNRTDFTLSDPDNWGSTIITYLKLVDKISPEDVAKSLSSSVVDHANTGINVKRTMVLKPIRDYYQMTDNGRVRKMILSLAVIAVLIVVLAISNFVNITLASSFSRLKEVGVRKVIGGRGKQVVIQFLSESIVISFLAGLVGLAAYELLRQYFSDLLGSALPSMTTLSISVWCCILGGLLTVGFIAGIYPALYLSASGTIDSLKGKLRSVNGTVRVSRGLIGTQFLIAAFISVTGLIVARQMKYFLQKDLGYDKSFVVTVTSVPRLWSPEGLSKMDAAREQFLKINEVEDVSLSWGAPNGNFVPMGVKVTGPGKSAEEGIQTSLTWADESFDDVFHLKVSAGKFFDTSSGTQAPSTVILNETAQRALQVEPGDKVNLHFNNPAEFTVGGIVKDFHYESLRDAVKPLAIAYVDDFVSYRYFSFRLKPGDLVASVNAIEQSWKNVFPSDPFVYSFVDDSLARLYKTESQLQKASKAATALMIIIMMTGVVGLVSLNVSKRTKEIAIRKVLGASAGNLVMLLSKEYILVMIAAFAIGIPLSYWVVSNWLESFVYRIDLQWWMFLAPAILLVLVTLVIVSAQSLKTIFSNPVKSIRYE